ncbi:hypothetical protein L1286_22395 [Pseudoalteromonas sp. SMS1]|uniref:hypothetical protein n=1 Tax=Pseudoalteromonas sp. SMS1 TaxID=2908894 RepID=UPI001F249EB3|nr:hypothetical protein [Pseudoalteromonas sp. SMS1]MCF2860235.1 hypothetical protein [Pseudoalteromonas sp. SMS1]
MIKPVSHSNHHAKTVSSSKKRPVRNTSTVKKSNKTEFNSKNPDKDLKQKIAGVLEARFGHAFAQEAEFKNMVEAIFSQVQSSASKDPKIAELVKLASVKK